MEFAKMAGVLHIDGPDGASTVELMADAAPLTIGRGESARVRLKDDKKQISREHLLLQWGEQSGQLTVLGQLACTVRGEAFGTGSKTTVAAGDVIVVGDFRLVVRLPMDRAAERPWQAPPVDNGRLNNFLATPAVVPVAPTFTQWSHGGPRAVGPVASAPQAAAVPGLDAQPRRPADLLGQFIAPASEGPLHEPAARADRSVAWTPAAQVASHQPVQVADGRSGAARSGAGAAASAEAAERTPPGAPLAERSDGDANPNLSGVLGSWIQPAGTPPQATRPTAAAAAAAAELANPEPAPMAMPALRPLSGWGIEQGAEPQVPAPQGTMAAARDTAAAPACEAPSVPDDARPTAPAPDLASRCLVALAEGLGIDAMQTHAPEDWQRMGVTVRLLVDGLRLMLSDRKALRSELRVPDPTQFYYSDNNPLKTELALQELVSILMSSSETARTFMPFDSAVQEAVDDLRSHNLAIIAATRATVVGVIQEFDPQKLRATLPGAAKTGAMPEGAPSFLERGRLWKAYADRYDAMNVNLADWIERVFDRHFITAYSREATKQRSR